MHALYYNWGENSFLDIEEAFSSLAISYRKISTPFTDYLTDDNCMDSIRKVLHTASFDFIFSFNYFPFLSVIAEEHAIPYLSWVYDCPHFTLFTKTIYRKFNYFFLFDREMCQTLVHLGVAHAFHMPLGVNVSQLDRQLGPLPVQPDYNYDISFVGSLYHASMFDQIHYLPDYLSGYLNAIMNSQQLISNYNFIPDLLTDDIVVQLEKYINLSPHDDYFFTSKQIFTDMINTKISSTERIRLLCALARQFSVDLFSTSPGELCPAVVCHGPVSYLDTMPSIFRTSKINLNISLRSITSGIPLRCLDILGAGGFLLSNYQPEFFDYFTPGVDFVYYEIQNDLMDKVSYYLDHEQERIQIAASGYRAVSEQFSYTRQLRQILSCVF